MEYRNHLSKRALNDGDDLFDATVLEPSGFQ